MQEPLREVDDEVMVDVYEEVQPFVFERRQVKVPVFEYYIICEVDRVSREDGKGKRVKIGRTDVNRVHKHMEHTSNGYLCGNVWMGV